MISLHRPKLRKTIIKKVRSNTFVYIVYLSVELGWRLFSFVVIGYKL